jgi:hypothetical protein
VRTVIRRLLVLLACTATVAGCGVPLDDAPRDLSGAGLPARSEAPSANGQGRYVERLCLVRDNKLARIGRQVPSPRSPATQLADLVAGPNADEAAQGLTSALSTESHVTLTVNGGHATVDLGDRADQAVRSDDVLAFGQIVCTLTAQLPIGLVSFTSGGEPLNVPRGDASLSAGPLTIADYVNLLAT